MGIPECSLNIYACIKVLALMLLSIRNMHWHGIQHHAPILPHAVYSFDVHTNYHISFFLFISILIIFSTFYNWYVLLIVIGSLGKVEWHKKRKSYSWINFIWISVKLPGWHCHKLLYLISYIIYLIRKIKRQK